MTTTSTPKTRRAQPISDVLIVGAGISGIAAAIRLQKAGHNDMVIIERANEVGGTWRENTYPGCGCDVPSSLYSFSFFLSSRWSRLFAKQPEILSYLKEVADHFGVTPRIRFNTALDEARWNARRSLWEVDTNQGQLLARTVIFATGPITEAQTPNIPGLNSFTGKTFHSAHWDHNYDLSGKRVAVIGTGASAIQFIPEIQPKVKSLIVLQRTAPWVLPKPDFALNNTAKDLIERLPVLQQSWRSSVSIALNAINFGLRNPAVLRPISTAAKQLLRLQVQDPALRKAVEPNFTLGCKRILFANNYYPALQTENTTLVPHGLVAVEGNTIVAANGERHEVDVIIWGTGFEVSHPPIGKRVIDAHGKRLSDRWKDTSPEAYLGTSLEDVPNAFLMLGPNVLVYDSFIGLAEAQLDYIVDALNKIKQLGLTRYSIRPKVLTDHNIRVQKHLKGTVFNSGGCKSYYLDANGRNFAAWPWSLAELKRRLQTFNPSDYEVVAKAS